MKKVFALLLALTVMFSLAACGKKENKKEETKAPYSASFSSPDEFYRAVEKRAVNSVTDTDDTTVGVADKLFSADGKNAVQGNLTVSVSKDITDLLTEAADVDMSWLKSVGVTFTLDQTQKDLPGGKATVQLNGTDLINVDAMYEKDSCMAYLRVAEFSDKYIGVDVRELLEEYARENGYDETYMLLSSLIYDDGTMEELMNAMPDADTISKLIEKYTDIVTRNLKDVKQGKEEVTAGGVTCTYDTLTVKLDKAQLETIIKDVVQEASNDKDLKEIIINIANASGEDGNEIYEELRRELLDEDFSIEDEVNVVMVLYVDSEGDIKGRDIKIDVEDGESVSIRFINAEKDGKFGTDILFQAADGSLSVTGGGTNKDDVVKGKLTVSLTESGETHQLGTIDIDGDVKSNDFVGEITLTPSEELLDLVLEEADLPEFLEEMVRGAQISFINQSTKDHLDMSLVLKSGGAELISLRFECQEAAPLSLSVPSDYADPETWAGSIDESALIVLMGNLQKAGMPMSILGSLMG